MENQPYIPTHEEVRSGFESMTEEQMRSTRDRRMVLQVFDQVTLKGLNLSTEEKDFFIKSIRWDSVTQNLSFSLKDKEVVMSNDRVLINGKPLSHNLEQKMRERYYGPVKLLSEIEMMGGTGDSLAKDLLS